jgi:hypothetical protein
MHLCILLLPILNLFIWSSLRSRSWTKLPSMVDFFLWTPSKNRQLCLTDLHLLWNCWIMIAKSYPNSSHSKPQWFTVLSESFQCCFWVSSILAQSTKSWWHCIIAFHCTIPCASWLHHRISINSQVHINLEQDCRCPIPHWSYPW